MYSDSRYHGLRCHNPVCSSSSQRTRRATMSASVRTRPWLDRLSRLEAQVPASLADRNQRAQVWSGYVVLRDYPHFDTMPQRVPGLGPIPLLLRRSPVAHISPRSATASHLSIPLAYPGSLQPTPLRSVTSSRPTEQTHPYPRARPSARRAQTLCWKNPSDVTPVPDPLAAARDRLSPDALSIAPPRPHSASRPLLATLAAIPASGPPPDPAPRLAANAPEAKLRPRTQRAWTLFPAAFSTRHARRTLSPSLTIPMRRWSMYSTFTISGPATAYY